MHYYKRNIGDYSKKAGRLSMLEHGAYTLLLDACYDRERFPTEEEAIDWCWARTEQEIAAVRFVLSRFFTLEDGIYVQARIREELEAYRAKAEKNAEIARNREEKRRAEARSVHAGARNVHEASTNGHLTKNQEPITKNQEKKNPPISPQAKGETETIPGLDAEAWEVWIDYRTKIRKPVKPVSILAAQRKLAAYGCDQMAVVQQSIADGYQGLFELKSKTGKAPQHIDPRQAENKPLVPLFPRATRQERGNG